MPNMQKSEKIIKEAKAEGRFKMGLDSNKELFTELEQEMGDKLHLLASMIDENE